MALHAYGRVLFDGTHTGFDTNLTPSAWWWIRKGDFDLYNVNAMDKCFHLKTFLILLTTLLTQLYYSIHLLHSSLRLLIFSLLHFQVLLLPSLHSLILIQSSFLDKMEKLYCAMFRIFLMHEPPQIVDICLSRCDGHEYNLFRCFPYHS